jgi:hypothetical protein
LVEEPFQPPSNESSATAGSAASSDPLRSPSRSTHGSFGGGSTAERLAQTRRHSGLGRTAALSGGDDGSDELKAPPSPKGASPSFSLADLSAWEARNTRRLEDLRTPQTTGDDVSGNR